MELIGRVSIGLATCNVSIYYPPATLLYELHREILIYAKENNGSTPT